jgi:Domain of unknown function (DUF4062)
MDKRYQVFVSSTYEDLKEERQEVIQALLELDCIPAGMELFPAADEDQWSLIKKVIDDCDFYIVIVGGRYGSVSDIGISYTQMEYEYAVSQGKPIIGFIHRDPGSIAASKTENSAEGKLKLESFRGLVQQKMCKHWNNPSELGSVVSRSLVKLIKNKPAIGWVRGNLVPSESSSKEILQLKKRVEELESELENSRFQAPKGTEELAQGDDEFEINFAYESFHERPYSPGSSVMMSTDEESHWDSFSLTWNQIFSELSPVMINEASDSQLVKLLNQYIQVECISRLKEKHPKKKIRKIWISGDDFQTIKIQLRALELIRESKRQRSVKDSATYWTLTPYGDNVMTRLRAIRSI